MGPELEDEVRNVDCNHKLNGTSNIKGKEPTEEEYNGNL